MKKDIYINIVEYVISFLVMIVSSRLIINGLGKDVYAIYSAITLILAMSMLIDSGLSVTTTASVIRSSKNKKNQNVVISTSLYLYLIISCVFILSFLFFSNNVWSYITNGLSTLQTNKDILTFIPLVVALNLISNSFIAKAIADGRWNIVATANVITKVISLIGVFIAIYFYKDDKLLIIVLFVFVAACVRFAVFYTYVLRVGYVFSYFSQLVFKKIISKMLYSSIAVLSLLIIYFYDKSVFMNNFGVVELSYLTFSFLIANYIHGFYGQIYKVFFSKLVLMKNFSSTRDYKKFNFLFVSFSVLVSVCIYIIWIPIISFLISDEFAIHTYKYASIILILSSLRTIEIILHYSYHAIGNVKSLSVLNFVMAIYCYFSYPLFIGYFNTGGTLATQIIGMLFIYIPTFLFFIFNSGKNEIQKNSNC